MGYLDKMHKKAQRDKMIREIMNSHEYKMAQKKDREREREEREREREQDALCAYCNFCLMACEFLKLKHNYGHKRLHDFLKFALEKLQYIGGENEKYYEEMNQYFIDKYKVDVFEIMGIKIVEEGAVNG